MWGQDLEHRLWHQPQPSWSPGLTSQASLSIPHLRNGIVISYHSVVKAFRVATHVRPLAQGLAHKQSSVDDYMIIVDVPLEKEGLDAAAHCTF